MIFFLILFIEILENKEFNPHLFTKHYQQYYNKELNKFKCFFSDQYFDLTDINNGICDCCDGTDEFLNLTYCFNTCPISLKNEEITILKNLYDDALKKRQELEENRAEILNDFTGEIQKKKRAMEILDEVYNDDLKNHQRIKDKLKAWVYKMLEIEPPSPEKEEEEKMEYINKIDLSSFNVIDNDEEGDEDENVKSTPKINDLEIELMKEKRSIKWSRKKQKEYNKLVKKALKMYHKYTGNNTQNPDVYSNYLKSKHLIRVSKHNSSHAMKLYKKYESRLHNTPEENFLWLGLINRRAKLDLPDEKMTIKVRFFDHAKISFSNSKDKKAKTQNLPYQPPVNRMMHFGPKEISDKWSDYSFSVRFVCFPQFYIFDIKIPVVSRISATIGLPEYCNSTFKEEDFQNYLHEVYNFKNSILNFTQSNDNEDEL